MAEEREYLEFSKLPVAYEGQTISTGVLFPVIVDDNGSPANKLVDYSSLGISGVETDLTEIKNRLTTAENDIDAAERDIDDLESVVGDAETEGTLVYDVNDLKDRVSTAEGKIATAEGDIDALEGRMDTAEDDIDALEGRMSTAESDIDAVEGRMDTAEGKISTLESKVSTAESKISTLEGKMTTAESKISTLESKMSTAESDIDALEGRMDTAEDDIDALESRMTTAEGDIDAVEGRLGSLEGVVGNAQTSGTLVYDVNDLKNRVGTIETSIEVIPGIINDVAALQDDVSDLQTSVSNLDTRTSTLEDNFSSLESRVSTNEGDIAVLNENVAEITEAVNEHENRIEDIEEELPEFVKFTDIGDGLWVDEDDGSGDSSNDGSDDGSGEPSVRKVVKAKVDGQSIIINENGEIAAGNIVPNINLISPLGTINISSSTDPMSNTKTFSLDVDAAASMALEFAVDHSDSVTWTAGENVTEATITLVDDAHREINLNSNSNGWSLKAGHLYQVNWNCQITSSGSRASHLPFTISLSGAHEETWKYDLDDTYSHVVSISGSTIVNCVSGATNLAFAIQIAEALSYSIPTVAFTKVSIVDLQKIEQSGGGGGTDYEAGDGITIESDTISAKIAEDGGLGFNEDGELTVKISEDISVEDIVDVVDNVQTMESDLDTKLNVTFDMANINNIVGNLDSKYPSSAIKSTNGLILCQGFFVPINTKIRTIAEDPDLPTLLGVYMKQNYSSKVILALYQYSFPSDLEPDGDTIYVGDTGPVDLYAGKMEYPLKHRNPDVEELSSSCLYYASIVLPVQWNGNLPMACTDSYETSGNFNTIPRFSIACPLRGNLNFDDPDTTLMDAEHTKGAYGPWDESYSEAAAIPRYFMQIRNGAYHAPEPPDPSQWSVNAIALNDDLGADNSFLLSCVDAGAVFMIVELAEATQLSSFAILDNQAQVNTSLERLDKLLIDNGGQAYADVNDYNNATKTIATESVTIDGRGWRKHTVTLASPITLAAGTYAFPVAYRLPDPTQAGEQAVVLAQSSGTGVETRDVLIARNRYYVNPSQTDYVFMVNDINTIYLEINGELV